MSRMRGAGRGFMPAATLLFVTLLVACHQPSPECPPKGQGAAIAAAHTETAPYGQTWIGNRINVDGIATFDPQVAHLFFDVPTSYVIEGWDVWPWASHAQRTAYWASEAEFEHDVAAQHGSLPGVQAVFYDPEAWAATPLDEQQNPAAAMQRFAALGHKLGLPVIITPGLTLAQVKGAVCTQTADEDPYAAYLRCNIAAAAAKYADVVEIQAQTLQGRPDDYLSFVRKAAAQAGSANSSVRILSGFRVRSQESLDAVKRTWAASVGTVDGYYLAMTPQDAAGLLQFITDCDSPTPAPA